MPDNDSAELTALVSREQAENAFSDALGIFVGKGRHYSVEQLAKGIGCKPKAIYDFRSYPCGHPDHRPLHFGLIVSITKFLGTDFTNEWLSLAGQVAADPLPLDHDGLCELATDYVDTKMAAHRQDSPGGPLIVDCERAALDRKVVRLRAVA